LNPTEVNSAVHDSSNDGIQTEDRLFANSRLGRRLLSLRSRARQLAVPASAGAGVVAVLFWNTHLPDGASGIFGHRVD